jgi:hypothetical protein
MQDAALLRSALMLTAMHFQWMRGTLGDMEETYLYHKVEAMRIVNDQLGDPVASSSDDCLYLVASLALSEVGFSYATLLTLPQEGNIIEGLNGY